MLALIQIMVYFKNMNTALLNQIANQIGSEDKNLVISVAIKSLIELGMSIKNSYNTVLGPGAYEKMAGEIYDKLK
jgi:hypothetical protein